MSKGMVDKTKNKPKDDGFVILRSTKSSKNWTKVEDPKNKSK